MHELTNANVIPFYDVKRCAEGSVNNVIISKYTGIEEVMALPAYTQDQIEQAQNQILEINTQNLQVAMIVAKRLVETFGAKLEFNSQYWLIKFASNYHVNELQLSPITSYEEVERLTVYHKGFEKPLNIALEKSGKYDEAMIRLALDILRSVFGILCVEKTFISQTQILQLVDYYIELGIYHLPDTQIIKVYFDILIELTKFEITAKLNHI